MTGLYVESRGDGRPLVLLHGWGLNLRVWDSLAPRLCERFRIICVDLPGHGRSEWRAESSAIERQLDWIRAETASIIGNSSFSVLGWSMGAQLALHWAATHPEGLESLVLVAATPRFTATPDWPCGTAEARLIQLAEGLRVDYRRTVGEFLELQVRGSASGEAVLAQLRAALFAHGEARPQALAAGLALLRESDLRPLLGAIALPALVIAGQYDRVTPPGASRTLARMLPNARYEQIHRAAHAPFLSHGESVAGLLETFLTDTA